MPFLLLFSFLMFTVCSLINRLNFLLAVKEKCSLFPLYQDGSNPVLRFAAAYGFRNIQNLMQKLKRGKCVYHFVEIMACPSGEYDAQ